MSSPSSALHDALLNLPEISSGELGKRASRVIQRYPSHADKIVRHIRRSFVEPGTRVGSIAAQTLMHGLTQTQLSAFHEAGKATDRSSRYLSIEQIVELSSGCQRQGICVFGSCKSKSYDHCMSLIRELSVVCLSDLILHTSFEGNIRPSWVRYVDNGDLTLDICANRGTFVITLDKTSMARYGVTTNKVSDILHSKSLVSIVLVSPNCESTILVYYNNMDELCMTYEMLKSAKISNPDGISQCKEHRQGDNWFVSCPSKYFLKLLSCDSVDVDTLFCNDPKTISEYLGISCARDLIYASLVEGSGIEKNASLTVADYMTWKGYPSPFTKSGVEGEYGPIFDMYFEKPKSSLRKWLVSGESDSLNTPYSQLVVGSQREDFAIVTGGK